MSLASLSVPFMVASASLPDADKVVFEAPTTADITAATGSIFDVTTAVLNEVVDNPVFMIFFVSGLVFMGVRIIRALKRV